jgi:hypothetical protein
MLLASAILRGQTGQCRLLESHVRLNPFQASSNSNVGQFSFVAGDTEITRVFRHDESGLDITVSVDIYKGVVKHEPTRIGIAILPGAKTGKIFDAINDTSEAVSVFDNHWRFLSVNRTVRKNDLFYTFTFSCERTPRKRSH